MAFWILAALRLVIEPSAALAPGTPAVADVGEEPGELRLRGKPVPFRHAAGRISWVVRDPRSREYEWVPGPHGGSYRPPTGVGDSFHYNRPGGLDPLTVGMKNDQPMPVDWDGDGRTDILQRNLYSTDLGEPWWGLYFFRNTGTNAAPVFARFVRVRADGMPAADPYASYALIDWDQDGHLDILAGIGSGPRRGQLQVYRNTGRRGADGLPVLTAGAAPSWGAGGTLQYGMRIFPGLGDLFTLRMKVEYFPKQEVDFTWFRHPRTPDGFGPGVALPLAGRTVYPEWPSTRFDTDGDGEPEWVGSTGNSRVVAWKDSSPPRVLFAVEPYGFATPARAEAPGFRGLFTSYMGGWLRYHELVRPGEWAAPRLLEAHEMPVSSGGYSSVEVADWEGDGDLDFLMGNETGFVQLVENISRGGRTMFATARTIPLDNGQPLYAARWMFIDDPDPERMLGQSKPAYVDWDGDGDFDLLVGNNSNRIAYFENTGTRRRPRFAPHRKLLHDGGEHFSFRARPAPADFDGDGLIDLVAGCAGARNRNDAPDIPICLYRRYRDSDGTLRLRQGPVLFRTPIPYHHGFEAVDWDGDGDIDILANERSRGVLYRNAGSNRAPDFRREPVLFDAKPLHICHHEMSMKAVDWDRDGRLDLITGGESGWAYYFHRSVLEGPLVRARTAGTR